MEETPDATTKQSQGDNAAKGPTGTIDIGQTHIQQNEVQPFSIEQPAQKMEQITKNDIKMQAKESSAPKKNEIRSTENLGGKDFKFKLGDLVKQTSMPKDQKILKP